MDSFDAYKRLSHVMQVEILLQFGVCLELTRHTPQLNIELYAVNDFYVEIYFEKKTGDPLFLKAFYSIYELEPYLPLIEIDSIFETN